MNQWDSIGRWAILFLLAGAISWLSWASMAKRRFSAGNLIGKIRATLLAGPGASLRCPHTIRLTPQHSLHLIEFECKRFLLVCHPGGAVPISVEREAWMAHREEVHVQPAAAA